MKAMVLHGIKEPLTLEEVPIPTPTEGELLIQIEACGVCRTDLHIVEGDLPLSNSPLILGHQIVGVVKKAVGCKTRKEGDRVGVSWLGSTCNTCSFCKSGKENLCKQAKFTGYNLPGGFAEYTLCKEEYSFILPSNEKATTLAPLLCAGLIGFRAYQKIQKGKSLGFYGFGSSAHLLLQLAKQDGKEVYVFTKPGDYEGQDLAKKLGATWVGSSEEEPPVALDGSILFAPSGELIPKALHSLERGGACVCAGIHMSDIPSFCYQDLFYEKSLSSISHLTKQNGKDFFSALKTHQITPITTIYPLDLANEALMDLKTGKAKGSLVLKITTFP